jgi:GNAT superfamily N-acetyltransferase
VSRHAGEVLISREPFDSPTAQDLIAQAQQEYIVRYGGPDQTLVDPAEFAPPRGEFLILRAEGAAQACGGWRGHLLPGAARPDAELKRMFVAAPARRRGLARVLLAELEESARTRGYARMILETGDRQPEAVALYVTAGYTRIPNFGYYQDEPGCTCYGKPL